MAIPLESNSQIEAHSHGYLSNLPSDWQRKKIGECFDIQQGKAVAKKHRKNINPRKFLRTANVYWGHLDLSILDNMDFTPSEEKRFVLKIEDLLVCEGGDIGRTAIITKELDAIYYQNHLHRLRAKNNQVYPEFVMYWLWAGYSVFRLYSGEGNKTTIPNLSQSRLSNFDIPLPPIEEQKAIAHVLTTIREAIEATEKVIDATRELKKSMMKHLFSFGPVPVNDTHLVELKETEIGLMPNHWALMKVEEVCDIQTSTLPYTSLLKQETRDCKDTLVHGIKVSDMNLVGNEMFIKHASIEAYVKSNVINKCLPPNSLVFPKRGAAISTNKKRITSTWTVIDPNIIGLTPIKNINHQFLYYWFLTFDLCNVQNLGPTPQLNKKDVAPIKLPIPPINEQSEIVRILTAIDKRFEVEQQIKQSLYKLFQSMLSNLMSGKIRVPVN